MKPKQMVVTAVVVIVVFTAISMMFLSDSARDSRHWQGAVDLNDDTWTQRIVNRLYMVLSVLSTNGLGYPMTPRSIEAKMFAASMMFVVVVGALSFLNQFSHKIK